MITFIWTPRPQPPTAAADEVYNLTRDHLPPPYAILVMTKSDQNTTWAVGVPVDV